MTFDLHRHKKDKKKDKEREKERGRERKDRDQGRDERERSTSKKKKNKDKDRKSDGEKGDVKVWNKSSVPSKPIKQVENATPICKLRIPFSQCGR